LYENLETNYPKTSCEFSFPIDNQSWQFLQQGTKIIICNVDGTSISKILLDMDTKVEAIDFLTRLQHYSSKARQEQAESNELHKWMQEAAHHGTNDSSVDESSTASVEEPSTTLEMPQSDEIPSTDFTSTFNTTFTQIPQPTSYLTTTQMLVSHMLSPVTSSSLRTTINHMKVDSQPEFVDPSVIRPQPPIATETNSLDAISGLQFDLFRDLQSEFVDSQDMYDLFPDPVLETPFNLAMESENSNFGASRSSHHPSLDHYYATLRDASHRWHSMDPIERDEWRQEE
jgi:hypothetical protein